MFDILIFNDKFILFLTFDVSYNIYWHFCCINQSSYQTQPIYSINAWASQLERKLFRADASPIPEASERFNAEALVHKAR
jgi:hypothetical protein